MATRWLMALVVLVTVLVGSPGPASAAEQHAWTPVGASLATTLPAGGYTADWFKVARNADGRPEFFMVDVEQHRLVHSWLRLDGTWGGWVTLLVNFTGTFAVTNEADGRLRVFASLWTSQNGTIMVTIAQNCANCGWEFLPASVNPDLHPDLHDEIIAGPDAAGRLQVFFFANDDRHEWYRLSQTAPNGGFAVPILGWTMPANVSRSDLAPTFAHNADGRPELFVTMDTGDSDGHDVWHASQRTDGTWSGWYRLHLPWADQPPQVVNESDGTLAVYEGYNGTIIRAAQVCPNCSWAPGWSGTVAMPTVDPGQSPFALNLGRAANGGLDAFVISAGDWDPNPNNPAKVWHAGRRWATWTDFGPLQQGANPPVPWISGAQLTIDGSGRLWYFVVGFTFGADPRYPTAVTVYALHQTAANGPWA